MSFLLRSSLLRRAALALLAAAALLVPCPSLGQPAAEAKAFTIAVIPKGTTHEFWKCIHAGAVKAAREIGVEIIWKGPQREDDRDMQIQVVEDFISRKVSGIVLAPLDDRALVRPVAEAKRRGIPVVVIDSGLQGDDFESFIATDNYKGGALGARRLGEIMGGKGKALLLRYQEGSDSTTRRENGFMDTIKKEFPGIEIVSSNQYAGATAELAYQKGENLLNRFADVQGIFCVNESSTFGMLRALTDGGKAGKIKFVGFDSSPSLLQAVEEGKLHGLVHQNPMLMGELGVKTMAKRLVGEPVEKLIDTGVTVVTKENMKDPDISALIHPPLEKYLN